MYDRRTIEQIKQILLDEVTKDKPLAKPLNKVTESSKWISSYSTCRRKERKIKIAIIPPV